MELNYLKVKDTTIQKEFMEKCGFEKIQCFNPLYSKFFNLNSNNYNSIVLNHKEHLEKIISKKGENVINCLTNTNEEKDVFVKFAPLLEPVKVLVGRYDINDHYLNELPIFDASYTLPNKFYTKKKVETKEIVMDTNNIPYVDGFFSFLSSKITENESNFHNGLKYYGSFLGI